MIVDGSNCSAQVHANKMLCMEKYAGVLGYEVLTKNVCVCHLGQIWPGVQGNKTSVLFVQKNLDWRSGCLSSAHRCTTANKNATYVELHVCWKESGCLWSGPGAHRCTTPNKNAAQDLQEIVANCSVEDFWEIVASHAVFGIVELRVYCFMGKIGSRSANRGRLESWTPWSSSTFYFSLLQTNMCNFVLLPASSIWLLSDNGKLLLETGIQSIRCVSKVPAHMSVGWGLSHLTLISFKSIVGCWLVFTTEIGQDVSIYLLWASFAKPYDEPPGRLVGPTEGQVS